MSIFCQLAILFSSSILCSIERPLLRYASISTEIRLHSRKRAIVVRTQLFPIVAMVSKCRPKHANALAISNLSVLLDKETLLNAQCVTQDRTNTKHSGRELSTDQHSTQETHVTFRYVNDSWNSLPLQQHLHDFTF